MRYFLILSFLNFVLSCSVFEDNNEICWDENLGEVWWDPDCPNYRENSICYGDDGCFVDIYTDFEKDENGYYHVVPERSRFNIHIESNAVIPPCQYGGVSVVRSKFDSNAFFEVESGISFTVPLYSPFESLVTQSGNLVKVKDTILNLDFFQGTIIPIVQNTSIYHDVIDKMACYGWDEPYSGPTPLSTGNCILYSKRIVGPVPNSMDNDTISVYSTTFFDCGSKSKVVKDSLKIIIEI